MATNLSSFLQSLESEGFDLRKGSESRTWVKKVYAHVDRYIVPVLNDRNEQATRQITEKLVRHLHCKVSEEKLQFPRAKEPIVISKLKDFGHIIVCENEDNKNPNCSGEDYESLSLDFEGKTTRTESQSLQYLLIGNLSHVGSVKKHLYVQDSSSRLLCHMVAPKPNYVDTVVLVEKWRFVPPVANIPFTLSGYIEALSEPVILHECHNATHPTVSTRMSKDIKGVVINVSSCLRQKSWIYIVHISTGEGEKIVVFQEKFAFWTSCMHKGCEVEITGLKKSKLKLNKTFYDILTPSSNSKFVVPKPVLMNINGGDRKIVSERIVEAVTNCKIAKNSEHSRGNCPVYIGEISSILSPELAIYLLDHDRVMLHCTYQLCADLGCALRVGALVLVTYVHSFKEGKNLHFVCCSQSNVQVLAHSTSSELWQPVYVFGNCLVKEFLQKDPYLLHPATTAKLPQLIEKMCKNLPFLTKRTLMPCTENDKSSRNFTVLKRILFKEQLSKDEDKPGSFKNSAVGVTRNMLSEVVSSPHTCLVQKLLQCPIKEFNTVSIKELCSTAVRKADEEFRGCFTPEYWSHFVFSCADVRPEGTDSSWDNCLLLLGCFKGSQSSGEVILVDNTGAIDCVIVKDVEDVKDENSNISDNLCTTDIDSFVRISRFCVVVETTCSVQEPTLVTCSADLPSTSELMERSVYTPKHHCYLICQTSDIEVLKRSNEYSGISCPTVGCSNIRRTAEILRKKEGPRKETGFDLNEGKTVICEEGSEENIVSPLNEETKSNFVFLTNIHFNKKYESSPSLCASGYLISKSRKDLCRQSSDMIFLQEVTLDFSGPMIEWKPLLVPGIVVEIISDGSSHFGHLIHIKKDFVLKHLHTNDQRISPNSIEMAQKQWKETFYWKCYSEIHSVSDVYLNPPLSSGRVSVRGRVHSRRDYMDEGKMHSKTEITDLTGRQKLCIYLGQKAKLPPIYVVIPGAVVVFQKIKIHVSAKGWVYGKYEPISSVVIESYGIPCSKLEEKGPNATGSTDTVHETSLPQIPSEPKVQRLEETTMERPETTELNTKDIHCTCIFNICGQNRPDQSESHDKVIKLDVFPVRVYNVWMTKTDDAFRCNEYTDLQNCDSIIFNACCLASDHTGRIIFHFNTSTMESFFKFLGLPPSHQREFLEIFKESKLQTLKYSSERHDRDNVVMDFPELAHLNQGSLAQSNLILLCNNVNNSILPSCEMLVRQRQFPSKKGLQSSEESSASENYEFSPYFRAGTVGVGSEEHDHMLSFNLKLLHFNCIEVL